jgi:hypothetical protein
MKYKLNIKNDVDVCSSRFSDLTDYILNLPYGFRFSDEVVHIRGYDSMAELKASAKVDVVPCDCPDCMRGLEKQRQKAEKLAIIANIMPLPT